MSDNTAKQRARQAIGNFGGRIADVELMTDQQAERLSACKTREEFRGVYGEVIAELAYNKSAGRQPEQERPQAELTTRTDMEA